MTKMMIFLFPVLLVAACGRDDVQTYQVPKEKTSAPAPVVAMQSPSAMQAPAAPTPPAAEFNATLPTGWSEVPSQSAMRMVSYSIEGSVIDFYLISLRMGDVPSNVNRWRGQVELPPEAPESIANEVQTFEVDGHEVKYIEIYNTEGGNGIIAAIVDLAPTYWYFTAKGPVDELQAHATEIRAFLESITFKGHAH